MSITIAACPELAETCPEPSEAWVRRGVVWTGAAMLSAAMALATVPVDIAAHDSARGATAREQFIEAGVYRALGQRVSVRCETPQEMRRRQQLMGLDTDSTHVYQGFTLPGLPLITLRDAECRAVTHFAAKPPQHDYDLKDVEVNALEVVGHEIGHTEGVIKERRAQCRGVWYIGRLGVAFGMPAGLVGRLVEADIRVQNEMLQGKSKITGYTLLANYSLVGCPSPPTPPDTTPVAVRPLADRPPSRG